MENTNLKIAYIILCVMFFVYMIKALSLDVCSVVPNKQLYISKQDTEKLDDSFYVEKWLETSNETKTFSSTKEKIAEGFRIKLKKDLFLAEKTFENDQDSKTFIEKWDDGKIKSKRKNRLLIEYYTNGKIKTLYNAESSYKISKDGEVEKYYKYHKKYNIIFVYYSTNPWFIYEKYDLDETKIYKLNKNNYKDFRIEEILN